jgi:hypothetical protein
MGQAASPSLYDYANGDPVDSFDPDGRFLQLEAEAVFTAFPKGRCLDRHFNELHRFEALPRGLRTTPMAE